MKPDTEIMELNKEIARLKQRIKELEKDSCAVCFNDGRQQALEEAIYAINYSEDLMDAINRVRALKEADDKGENHSVCRVLTN